MKNLNLSDDQFTELSNLTDEATNEAHKCRLFFEMEAKLEQAIDSCIPTLEKYQQNMKNWFVRDDLLFKIISYHTSKYRWNSIFRYGCC